MPRTQRRETSNMSRSPTIRQRNRRRPTTNNRNNDTRRVRKTPSAMHRQETSRTGSRGNGSCSTKSISEEGIRLMPYLFDILDVDSSGTLDRAEVIIGCIRKIRNKGLSITEKQLHDIETFMAEADTNCELASCTCCP